MSKELKRAAGGDVQFFSVVDKDPKTGEIKSEYPAWWHDRQMEELKNSIHSQQQYLDRNKVAPEHRDKAVAALERDKEKLSEVEESRPQFTPSQKDSIAKGFGSIQELIAEALPTQRQIDRNTVDHHQEAMRMSQPCISLKKHPDLAKFAQACNVPISRHGEISRDHATKMAHIMGRSLGERFFVENLRK